MGKLRIRLLIGLFAALLLLPGCVPEEEPPANLGLPTASPSASPAASHEIVVPSGGAVSNIFGIAFSSAGSLNPITGTSRLNRVFLPLLYEGLFAVGGDFKAQPVLCDRFTREGNAYLLHLNSKAVFSDGTDLTAADVKYSLEMAAAEGTLYSERLNSISAVTAIDSDNVRIDLSVSAGRFELLLDIPIIKMDSAGAKAPIGTGPYVYMENEGDYYLKANTGWWQGSGQTTQRIELTDAPEADLLINYFETGAISMVENDPTATDPVVFGGDYEEWSYPTSILYYLGTNTQNGPLTNAEIRSALSYAVDRDFICEAEMLRYADAAVLPVHPVSDQYDDALALKYAFSLSTFGDVLAKAGYTAEKPLEIDFVVNTDNAFKSAVAERISEDLRAMGVSVNLRELKWADYLKALSTRDFDLYLAEVKLSADFNLSALLSKEGALNFGGYSSDEAEALLASFLAADQNTIAAASSALYSKIAEDAPIIPILFKRQLMMAKRGVLDAIAPTQYNLFSGMKK